MFKAKQIISTGVAHNALATGTIIRGSIRAEEDLRIDGIVEGNIECSGKVVVGPQAEISGNIRCLNAELMGKVHGNIETKEVLCLKGSVVYKGDVLVGMLEIEAGAVFNGTCTMQQQA